MRAIDAWVNVDMPRTPTGWQKDVVEKLFKKSADSVFRRIEASELIALMDASGVERAILTLQADRPSKKVLEYGEQYPDRFSFSAIVDPRRGVKATAELRSIVGSHDVRVARVIPGLLGAAPDDRIYYPLYAKCIELGMPISVNTGMPGPPFPGRLQDPMHLDEVCLFFPELVVIMANGADPWWNVAIRLMLRHRNLYMKTSAYAPKYLPAELIHFMNRRGRDKVMFATDFPFLEMERCLSDARALELEEDALAAYLYGNAERVLLAAK